MSLGELSSDRRTVYDDYVANQRSIGDENPQSNPNTDNPPGMSQETAPTDNTTNSSTP